ncbi:MAG: hypothetical protein ACOWWR_03185 [Eubacteriales bacterium]
MNGKYKIVAMRITALILSFLFIIITSCNSSNKRNVISFKVPAEQIADTIKVMNSIIGDLAEVNYYIDGNNILLFGTEEVGKLDSTFIIKAKKDTSKYSQTDIRLFNIILFLKQNEINSCFRHRDFGAIVYDYRPTKDDRFDDVRYIILQGDVDINSARFLNSQVVLDKKSNLFLIAPKGAKIN